MRNAFALVLLATLTAACFGLAGCGGDDSPTTPGSHLFVVTISAIQDGPADGGVGTVLVRVTPRFHASCVDDGGAEKNECLYIVLADRTASAKRTEGGTASLRLPIDPLAYTLQARHVSTPSVSETVEITVR